jgi:hypothetical protein
MHTQRWNVRPPGQEGSVLVVTLCFTAILLMTSATMLTLSKYSLSMSARIREDASALALAEAGVADMLGKMGQNVSNYLYWIGRTNTQNFGEGSFTVFTTQNTNTQRVLIDSTGSIDNNARRTVLEILGHMEEFYTSALGVDGCILAGGDITFHDAAGTINGSIHANGIIENNTGAQKTINGSATCAGDTISGINVGTNSMTPLSPVRIIPDYRPFTDWEELAKNGGIYIDGNKTWQNGATADAGPPKNGVIYVNGNAHFRNNSQLVGHLIASGDISHDNNFNHVPVNTNWPAMLAGGDIDLRNRGVNYYGVIWSANDIRVANLKTIDGALIALNNVYMQNNSTLTPLSSSPAWGPLAIASQEVRIVIGGWIR